MPAPRVSSAGTRRGRREPPRKDLDGAAQHAQGEKQESAAASKEREPIRFWFYDYTMEDVGAVARPRRDVRAPARYGGAAAVVRNVVYSVHRQQAQPPEQLWEIPSGEEGQILTHCC